MSYSVKEKSGTFDIFEKGSNVMIELSADEKRAKDVCRKLNLGSGFNGWTPPFFAIKYDANDGLS